MKYLYNIELYKIKSYEELLGRWTKKRTLLINQFSPKELRYAIIKGVAEKRRRLRARKNQAVVVESTRENQ